MLGGEAGCGMPLAYLCQTEFGPRPKAPLPTCVPLFQALYWSIRSEKLEWAV